MDDDGKTNQINMDLDKKRSAILTTRKYGRTYADKLAARIDDMVLRQFLGFWRYWFYRIKRHIWE